MSGVGDGMTSRSGAQRDPDDEPFATEGWERADFIAWERLIWRLVEAEMERRRTGRATYKRTAAALIETIHGAGLRIVRTTEAER